MPETSRRWSLKAWIVSAGTLPMNTATVSTVLATANRMRMFCSLKYVLVPSEKMTISRTMRQVPRMKVPALVVNQLPMDVSVSLPV